MVKYVVIDNKTLDGNRFILVSIMHWKILCMY